ncbi:hypothetical protein KK083_07140 [Fulvivirgaceae bacterium PWU4]|uniref:Lipocalin-like domain-containing protein n=1 Tax=Chryseosolibacter histidini TaxID=2782349 RepID=A0AAP2DHY9_9BACT|nr:hypothetical protein [Chryseosolibacter histidini]MBT1696641.1 hypothetical protein [Chryseosolibacter histidini]
MMNYIQQLQYMRRSVYMLAIMISVVYLSGCDGGDEPGAQEIFMDKLAGSWTLRSGRVTVNDVDVTGAFKELAITFNKDMSYNVTNPAASLWPQSGSFTLQPSDADALFNIVRDDNVVVAVKELTATTVTLAMQYAPPGGRVKSVGGQYVFKMNR